MKAKKIPRNVSEKIYMNFLLCWAKRGEEGKEEYQKKYK